MENKPEVEVKLWIEDLESSQDGDYRAAKKKALLADKKAYDKGFGNLRQNQVWNLDLSEPRDRKKAIDTLIRLSMAAGWSTSLTEAMGNNLGRETPNKAELKASLTNELKTLAKARENIDERPRKDKDKKKEKENVKNDRRLASIVWTHSYPILDPVLEVENYLKKNPEAAAHPPPNPPPNSQVLYKEVMSFRDGGRPPESSKVT